MKPGNHAIRQLEKQLEGATPEVAEAIVRVIASLNEVLMNKGDQPASAMARNSLEVEIAALAKLTRKS